MLSFYSKIKIEGKKLSFLRTCENKYASQMCEYANLSMCGEISCFMEFVIKKQDKTDKGTSPEESFIQNSSWISVRREKMQISYVYETHEVDCSLLDFRVRKLCSVMLKILRVLHFDTKPSIKRYLIIQTWYLPGPGIFIMLLGLIWGPKGQFSLYSFRGS